MNPMEGCVRKLNAMFLEQYVLYELLRHLEELPDLERIWEERRRELEGRLEKRREERRTEQSGLRALHLRKRETYEQYSLEKGAVGIDGGRAKELGGSLDAINRSIAQATSRLAETEAAIKALEADLETEPGVEGLAAYFGLSELTRETAKRFIRQIAAREGQKPEISWKDG